MAQRKKLDDIQTQKILLDALKKGRTRGNACAKAGITDETLKNYCNANLDFLEKVWQAERDSIGQIEEKFRADAYNPESDWRCREAYLKRRMPEEWGDKITHGVDNEINALIDALTRPNPDLSTISEKTTHTEARTARLEDDDE